MRVTTSAARLRDWERVGGRGQLGSAGLGGTRANGLVDAKPRVTAHELAPSASVSAPWGCRFRRVWSLGWCLVFLQP